MSKGRKSPDKRARAQVVRTAIERGVTLYAMAIGARMKRDYTQLLHAEQVIEIMEEVLRDLRTEQPPTV